MGQRYNNEQLERFYLNACNRAGRWIPANSISFRKAGIPATWNTYCRRFKTVNDLKSIIENKYEKEIKFNPNDYKKEKSCSIESEDEFYALFIEESKKLGFKMNSRNVTVCEKMPSINHINSKFGCLKNIHKECSLRSKDFAKLPEHQKIEHNGRGNLTKKDIATEYINKCLLFGRVYSVDNTSFAKLNISFSVSVIRVRFGRSSKDFYSYCRKISPEYDKLFKGSSLDRDQKAK